MKNPDRQIESARAGAGLVKLADCESWLSILEKNFPGFPPRCAALIAAALLLILPLPVVAESAPLDLEGTWYVLVHHRDSESPDPEASNWEDKIWRFESKGSRLKWTEYPIVLFEDESQRFEKLPGGRQSRILHAWAPSPEQQHEIQAGLRVNSRDALAKTLRGDAQLGYQSTGGMRTESASVIGFSQSWEIRDLAGLPVFRRRDEMGSARTENLEGETSYRTTSISDDRSLLEGRFDRDGVQLGSFRMLRAGEVKILGAHTKREKRPQK